MYAALHVKSRYMLHEQFIFVLIGSTREEFWEHNPTALHETLEGRDNLRSEVMTKGTVSTPGS